MKPIALRHKKGQATIEFAFALAFVAAFLLALTDMTRIFYNWMVLQYATNEGARYGSLGATSSDGTTREQAISNLVTQTAQNLGITLCSVTLTDEGGGSSAGAPSTFFTLKTTSDLTLSPLTGLLLAAVGDYGGTYSMTAVTVIRNEPFTVQG